MGYVSNYVQFKTPSEEIIESYFNLIEFLVHNYKIIILL